MTPYPEYKATNLPWLPQIPAHWDIVPFAACAKEKSITNQSDLELLSVYLDRGVIRFSQEAAKRTNVTSEDLSKYQRVDVGDLVLNNQQAWRGSVGVSSFTGIVSPAYIVLKLSDRLYSKFANYLFRDNLMVAHYVTASKGIGSIQRNLYWVNLKRKNLFLPPIDEQEQIVRYLDSMMAKINKLIRAKKKQIALLQEQKQAIINQAVTKGLNPNAEMKDSGIDWLGQIPVHWTIKNFSKVASIKSNLVKPENYYDYPQVSPDKIEKHTGKLLPVISVKEAGIISNNHLFFKGQILYSKIRPLLNKVTIAPFDGLCSADMYPIETILETEYLKFFMLSTWFLYQIKQSGDRVKMPKINQEEMAKLEIVIPTRKEQKDIVCFIYEHWNQFDIVLQSLEKSIQTLSEYKNSLIASVVTGQVDIRNIQVEDFDPADLISETDDDPPEDDDQPQEESEVE